MRFNTTSLSLQTFEVKAGNVYAVAVIFAAFAFHAGSDGYQLPSLIHHRRHFAVDYRIVGGNVLKADTANVVEVEDFGFLEILHSNLVAAGFVSAVVFF